MSPSSWHLPPVYYSEWDSIFHGVSIAILPIFVSTFDTYTINLIRGEST